MKLIQITSTEQLKEFRDDWSLILEENQNSNPFIEFVWIYEWWKHLGDEHHMEIIAVQQGDRIVAFFPFLYKKRWYGYTYNFMALGQANYMDFVVNEHLLDSAIEFVIDEIIRKRKHVVFYLHGLLESSKTPKSLEAYFEKRKAAYSFHRVITPYIDLEKIKLKEYMNKRKKLYKLDRRENRLRSNGVMQFLPSGPKEMDIIFKLHDKRWKKRNDTSGFTNEKEKDFYRSLAHITEGPMITEIDSLYINDTIIAFDYGFKCRGRYLGYIMGYDDDFEFFSPGRILEKEKILKCKSGSVKKFDLSIGYEPYKFEWSTHVDYTRTMIFSSNAFISKVVRSLISKKESTIIQIKKNRKLVLLKRLTFGKLLYFLRNLFSESESINARSELIRLLIGARRYLYEREKYIVYKLEKKDVPDFADSETFIELTINDLINSKEIANKHMKEVCRNLYGGYKGYHPETNLSFENIFWMNDKVIRIEDISYIEELRKSAIYIMNWHIANIADICTYFKRESKAKTLYVCVKEASKKEVSVLESIGFVVSKRIFKKTYFGNGKHQIIE